MSKLVTLTVYAKDSTAYTSASPQSYNSDTILYVENATLSARQSVPSASGSINSVVISNYDQNNSGERHTLIVGETQATIVTASA